MSELLSSPEEQGEKKERYREQQTVTLELEQKIIQKISEVEKYPDVIFCPNKNCGNPINIEIKDDVIRLYCGLCGFERILSRNL